MYAVLILALIQAAPALADDGSGSDGPERVLIEFGVSVAPWEGNRLCDDPRFINKVRDSRMSSRPPPEALFQDADDCRAAFLAKGVVPRMDFEDVEFAGEPQYLDFDGSPFRYTDDCRDPRLEGPGAKGGGKVRQDGKFPLACRVHFLSGTAILKAKTKDMTFHYGYNGGMFAYDGECDDPRFEGEGMASTVIRQSVGRDASDCKNASVEATLVVTVSGIDFGNNASRYSYDGECDDPRFKGEGMAASTNQDDERKDAIDCFRAYNAGRISELRGLD